ncbi:hypothetical protein [Sphaerotilus mobilis]|uniref:Uncharacterized protein n=1 Tax=Sphaerotilus mobilis TaxID=47994 RepID=A0A4Q7LR15_9BURK|nr:hypothetical protein [Sphaerotilus mobilis]RZS56713.1 hypothetical protein EV685_1267 [Sphaerotilus mobilis]
MTPGTFLRPVSRTGFSYCFEVIRVWPPHEWTDSETWQCRRWGVDRQGRPVDDGREGHGYSLSGLTEVAPSVWRDLRDAAADEGPTYWRRIQQADQPGQLPLF